MPIQITEGDALKRLKEMPDNSVHCCITSPPYYGLRDYGVEGQIGLEPAPEEYIGRLVEVFAEVRRVLRDDGTLWVNIGDSFATNRSYQVPDSKHVDVGNTRGMKASSIGLKPKDLIGIPWMLAFALRSDGWYLRSDIIWAKGVSFCPTYSGSVMPESVADRPTRAHEYVFLLSKKPHYYFDMEAIMEDGVHPAGTRAAKGSAQRRGTNGVNARPEEYATYSGQRQPRSVWAIGVRPFPEAHFATFAPGLIEPMVKASTSEKGCCSLCGAPWKRLTKKQPMQMKRSQRAERIGPTFSGGRMAPSGTMVAPPTTQTLGWQPTCPCDTGQPIPCTVLDPFAGAGTTGLVADRLGRDAILIELNPDYAAMARRRIEDDAPLFAQVSQE